MLSGIMQGIMVTKLFISEANGLQRFSRIWPLLSTFGTNILVQATIICLHDLLIFLICLPKWCCSFTISLQLRVILLKHDELVLFSVPKNSNGFPSYSYWNPKSLPWLTKSWQSGSLLSLGPYLLLLTCTLFPPTIISLGLWGLFENVAVVFNFSPQFLTTASCCFFHSGKGIFLSTLWSCLLKSLPATCHLTDVQQSMILPCVAFLSLRIDSSTEGATLSNLSILPTTHSSPMFLNFKIYLKALPCSLLPLPTRMISQLNC